jgi:hypothetical protein
MSKKTIETSEKTVLEAILGKNLPDDCEISIEVRELPSKGAKSAGGKEGAVGANIRKYLLEHMDAVARRNMVMHEAGKAGEKVNPGAGVSANIQKYLTEHKDAVARRNMVMHEAGKASDDTQFGADEKAVLEGILGSSLPESFELTVEVKDKKAAGANIQRYLVEHMDAVARRNMVMHEAGKKVTDK